MDPAILSLLTLWEWRLDVSLILLAAGALYSRGWWRLRKSGGARLASGWRLAAYLVGLVITAISLMSPIDVLGGLMFSFHMLQHLLFMMLGAPLMLLANPFLYSMWGLPQSLRRRLGRLLFGRKALFRRGLYVITQPGATWLIYIIIFLGWHTPIAYNSALLYDWVHDIQHLTFFGSAILFWWPITAAAPRIHPKFPIAGRLIYLFFAFLPNMLAGATIALATKPLYSYYLSVPRVPPWNLTVLEDQMVAGVIMWVPGSMMYVIAALILVVHKFGEEAAKPPLPESEWATDEAMLAPGGSRHF